MKNNSILDICIETGVRIMMWAVFIHLENTLPFMRHIEEEEAWYYKYPNVEPIIPVPQLLTILCIVPLMIYPIQFWYTRDLDEIEANFLGLTFALPLNGIITALFKVFVGRPRPNFILRCFPAGFGNNFFSCPGDYMYVMDGRKSFPSSHASFAFTEFTYITLNLVKITRIKDIYVPPKKKGLKLILCLLPLVMSTCIGITRTMDYHHHYSDVAYGSMLGAFIGTIAFYLFSPVPVYLFHKSVMGPFRESFAEDDLDDSDENVRDSLAGLPYEI